MKLRVVAPLVLDSDELEIRDAVRTVAALVESQSGPISARLAALLAEFQ